MKQLFQFVAKIILDTFGTFFFTGYLPSPQGAQFTRVHFMYDTFFGHIFFFFVKIRN